MSQYLHRLYILQQFADNSSGSISTLSPWSVNVVIQSILNQHVTNKLPAEILDKKGFYPTWSDIEFDASIPTLCTACDLTRFINKSCFFGLNEYLYCLVLSECFSFEKWHKNYVKAKYPISPSNPWITNMFWMSPCLWLMF